MIYPSIKISAALTSIRLCDVHDVEAAQARQDNLTKPMGSLGALERYAVRISAIQQRVKPRLPVCEIHCYAADHGVAAAGVSAFPQEVTAQMIANVAAGGAAVSNIARTFGIGVRALDVGVVSDTSGFPGVWQVKVVEGTKNMLEGPAMEPYQCMQAIEVGISQVERGIKERGLSMVGLGEVGIGNTTAAAAIISVLTGTDPAEVTGRGTGISDEGLAHKIETVRKAIAVNEPNPNDALDVLSKVGGLEIAAMCGTIIGAASCGIPVVLDGAISTAAALCAVKLCKDVREYLFASHVSAEPASRMGLAALALTPVADLGMRLGEGTGAALGMGIYQAAVNVMSGMATFDEAGVSNRE